MKTNDAQYDDALKQLARALRKTAGTEGRPRARRNARQVALAALRRVRGLLDEKAPAIVNRAGVQRLKTPEGRRMRLIRRGFVPVSNLDAADYAAAGIRLAKGPAAGGDMRTMFVPRWAFAIGTEHPSKLRAAKKDPLLRKSVVADQMLRESAR